MDARNSMVIAEKDLRDHLSDAQSYLESARQQVALGGGRSIGTSLPGQKTNDSVSVLDLVTQIDTDDSLFSETQLHVLQAIRIGAQIGFCIAELYRQRSGASSFDSAHGLTDSQKAEMNEKMQTAAAITLFVAARYMIWSLFRIKEGNTFVGNIPAEFDHIDISTPRSAVMCMMYYLGKHIEKETNNSDDRLVATVLGFAEVVEEAILNRQSGLKHTEPFTEVTYTLEDSDFSVSGFELVDFAGSVSVEFNRVEMSDIVGNADAKHFARRLVQRMVCYNPTVQMNVFTKLGGLAPVWMGYGKPGTGKSMLIAAIATMLDDYCRALGLPFLFHPLPDNLIDSFQGNSAKNMVSWMKAAHDTKRVVFMPVDDAENVLEERTRQGVSEGVRAVIGVFLRYTEGAYAVHRGNASIGVFTNLPEQIDAAVRSRIQGRMLINGADTPEDFWDQDYLWFRRFSEQEGFVNLSAPEYKYLSAQKQLASLGEAEQTSSTPQHTTVREVFDSVLGQSDPAHHTFFGQFYDAFMKRFSAFSSRDVRNIQSAVDQRIMDFDLPEEWFENPEVFHGVPFEQQEQMVLELRNANMKGLMFSEIYLQEVIRYCDNYATIADAEFDRAVVARLKEVRIRGEVERRLKAS